MSATWDDRLITRHHAADMAGAWDLKIDARSEGPDNDGFDVPVYLRCGLCDGNITKLPALTSIDGLIAAVVRHMTMNHGYSLSGSGYGADDSAAPNAARIGRSNRGAGDPVH